VPSGSMADVTKAIGAADARTGVDREVPVPGFNELTVEQAAKRLRRLPPDKLRRVRAYELAHKNRKTVLAAIDPLLTDELR
jgi:glycogen synthase